MKPETIIEGIAITIYIAAGLTFCGCMWVAILNGRFSARSMLIATTAAWIALAMVYR
jgi:hypothetical protein